VRLLLDSHVVLWSLYEPEQLSQRARDLIADLANELFISHVTMLEIANKVAARRLSGQVRLVTRNRLTHHVQ